MVRPCFGTLLLLPAVAGRDIENDDAALLTLRSQQLRSENMDTNDAGLTSASGSANFVQNNLDAYDDILKTQQSLLARVVQGGLVSSEEMTVFDVGAAFHKITEDLKAGVQNQRDMAAEANEIIADCNSRVSRAKDILDPKKSGISDKREAHKVCRRQELAKISAKNEACSEYEKNMGLARDPPDCAADLHSAKKFQESYVHDCIKQMQDWVCDFGNLEGMSTECTEANTALDNLDKDCDQKQLVFETEVCAYTEELHFSCIEQDMCIGDAVSRRDKMYVAMGKMNEQTAHLYVTMQKIMCVTTKFHDVTNGDVNASQVNVTECLHQNHDVPDDLTMELPDAVDKQECDVGDALEKRPGSAAFKELEYASFDGTQHSLEEPHVCDALPDDDRRGSGMRRADTYVRWGHKECPDGATLLYSGYASGAHYGHRGSGANTLCLHPDPTFSDQHNTAGNQNGALLYGTEYQNTGAIDKNHDRDAVCAVCAVKGTTFTQWGRNQCDDKYKTEYTGVVMSNHYTQQKGQFVCVDLERAYDTNGHEGDHNGNLWYTTEFEVGSLPSAVFRHDHEVSCAQCTIPDKSDTFVRWGHSECPSGADKVFTGFAASGHYGHQGSGYNALCLHPHPTYASGTHGGNQNGALIYGTEYQNTGAVDLNHDHDAVCALCAVHGASYTQWARDECPSGHRMEYKGVIMANHYTQKKNEFVCVDEARKYTDRSNRADHNGNLWYTTEFEVGSLPSAVFKHDHEASCAQCTKEDSVDTYVRWGHRECPSSATKVYTGFASSGHYGHAGSGANVLCLHPDPTYPSGVHGGNQNGALLYGTEYQNTGVEDMNHDHDAVCTVCAVTGATYTQWGRDECPSGHRQEYKGMIMANHYTQQKGEFVCVDEGRQFTTRSSTADHNGNLWYTTEFEQGSLPNNVYKHDHEATCAQCTMTTGLTGELTMYVGEN